VDALTIPWWLWLALGLGLIGAELFVAPGGLYLLFFGVSALVVGLLGLVGVATDPVVQLLLFALIAVLDLLLFRRSLVSRLRLGGQPDVAELVGETAVALGHLSTSGVGSAELRGAVWRVRNVGKFDVAAGQRCRVEHVDGLELWVRGV
jgi:membrane protein implicated in regulation of membrane protease activity